MAPPSQSIERSALRASRGRAISVSTRAAPAIGRFSQNTHGQPIRCTTTPPSAGPSAMNMSGMPT